MAEFLEILEENIRIFPFLFITYLFMEILEHKAGPKTKKMIRETGKAGPAIGGMLGAFPQCGFSAAASNLYAGRIITLGTLISIYLSTSDEMLPIMISEAADATTIIKILVTKVVIGMISGFVIDFVMTVILRKKKAAIDIHSLCEEEHCHCNHNEGGFWRKVVLPSLIHSIKVFAFIFVVSFVLHEVVHHVGEDALADFLVNKPVLGECLAGLVGLIPSCAGSVVVTTLYLDGIIGAGAMMSGLFVSAGVGLLILFRVNKNNIKENFGILALLYVLGVLWGVLIELLNITF